MNAIDIWNRAKKILLLILTAGLPGASDVGLSIGRSQTEMFNTARFAFPDLAQTDGRAGCCDLKVWEDKHSPALKVDMRHRFGDFGLTGSLAYLGSYDVSFDVSGNFSNPAPGRCVEHGTFNLFSAALAASYIYRVGEFEIEPSIGMAGNEVRYHTVSQCDFPTFSDHVDRTDHRFSWNPIYGITAAWRKWTFGADARRITLSNNSESQSYGMGRLNVATFWFGRRW